MPHLNDLLHINLEAEAQGYRTIIKGHFIELSYPKITPYSTNQLKITEIHCMLGLVKAPFILLFRMTNECRHLSLPVFLISKLSQYTPSTSSSNSKPSLNSVSEIFPSLSLSCIA